jgi:hypothetical protein
MSQRAETKFSMLLFFLTKSSQLSILKIHLRGPGILGALGGCQASPPPRRACCDRQHPLRLVPLRHGHEHALVDRNELMFPRRPRFGGTNATTSRGTAADDGGLHTREHIGAQARRRVAHPVHCHVRTTMGGHPDGHARRLPEHVHAQDRHTGVEHADAPCTPRSEPKAEEALLSVGELLASPRNFGECVVYDP